LEISDEGVAQLIGGVFHRLIITHLRAPWE
jgi:hypothetical protein